MADLVIGDHVKCQSNGNTDYDFYATIEKVYENSAFVSMTFYDHRDELSVAELQYRAVIALGKMKPFKREKAAKLADLKPVKQAVVDNSN